MLHRRVIAILIVAVLSLASVHAQEPALVQLRIEAVDLKHGVPERIGFVFTNPGDQPTRLPTIRQCTGNGFFGHVKLTLNFTPAVPPRKSKVPGGCGGGIGGSSLVYQARDWKEIAPHASFEVTFSRLELFAEEQDPGTYEFVGEYDPPELTDGERALLERSHIRYESDRLLSPPLRFERR